MKAEFVNTINFPYSYKNIYISSHYITPQENFVAFSFSQTTVSAFVLAQDKLPIIAWLCNGRKIPV